MSRIAIFVDAGYLFAQGSAALWGTKQPRISLDLNENLAIEELRAVALSKAPTAAVLRTYWYDGAVGNRGLSLEQLRLAQMDDVKVRLGFVNSRGQQKEVDSLIVTDLVELARNHAMTDALLLSGDGDVRIGVQIAQSFGVRLHLLGIVPSRGSQSAQLIQEADTKTEWDAATVQKLLAKRAPAPPIILTPPLPAVATPAIPAVAATPTATAIVVPPTMIAQADIISQLDTVTDTLVSSLTEANIAILNAYWDAQQRGVPREFDGRLIASGRTAIGRALTSDEMRAMRARFAAAVRTKS